MEQNNLNQVAYAQKIYENNLAKVVKLLAKKGMYRLSLSSVGTVESVHLARSTTPEDGTFVLRVLGSGKQPVFGHFNLLGRWQLGVAKAFKLDVGRLYNARSLADLEQLALVGEQNETAAATAAAAAAVAESELLLESNNGKKKKRKKKKKKKKRTTTESDETSSTTTGTTSSSHSSPSFTALSPDYSVHIPVDDITEALAVASFGSNTCCEYEYEEDETAFARDALQMTAAVTSAAKRNRINVGNGFDDVGASGGDSNNATQRVLELEARFGKLPDSGMVSAMEESIRQASEQEKKQQQRTEIFESISTNLFDDYVMQEKKRMEREANTGVDARYPCAASTNAKRNTRALSISSASSASLSSRSESPPLRALASPYLSRSLASELESLEQSGRCVEGRKAQTSLSSKSRNRQRRRRKNEQHQRASSREELPEDR